MRIRFPHLLVAAALVAGCSDSSKSATPSAVTSAPSDTTAVTDTAPVVPTTERAATLEPATFVVQPGTNQIAVLGAAPGEALTVSTDGAQTVVAVTGTVDEQGSLLFRNLEPGDGYTVSSSTATSEPVTVADPADDPPAEFYASQPKMTEGFGYITTRDGTTLSANVILPGPADQGPYPTLVEYSGYQPSDPGSADLAQIYTAMGFAYVGVNMRGTGCSGGSYRFFETVQSLDGYDVIETIASQPWVLDNEVGMVGISYPGITQLFVAATRPPSLNSITPLSVIDDSFRATLYPGGILNTGFAVTWTQQRMDESKPFGQAWTKDRADAGDTMCADNQMLRLQNPDLVREIDDNPYYSPFLGDSLAPITFVDRINVPVFIAGAWQDEQTGGHFPAMLDRFTGSPHVYVTLMNGLHTESLSPPVLGRYVEFLQLYVAKKVPSLAPLNSIAPVLGSTIWGVERIAPFDDRFAGDSYDEALAAFEAEPPIRISFEQGGNAAYAPGTPEPHFVATFPAWPIPSAAPTTWLLDGDGALTQGPLVKAGESSYTAEPDALSPTFYTGSGSDIWRADVRYDWQPMPDGTGLGFVTPPLAEDTVIAGSGSVDLWIQATSPDTDLEVTISEVRPDGQEIYVQGGWLRASQRALADSATALRPAHTNLEADAADLPAGELTEVRVELFSFAHPFRAGSRLRLTIDAPGGNRPVWEFRTIAEGETVTIAHDADHPSKLVLPVVTGVEVPSAAPPACGSLRGQPCRTWVEAANGG